MKSGFTYHLHATKAWVKFQIQIHGVKSVLGFDNVTEADAFQAIDDLPGEYIPVGNCEHRDTDGRCLGHERIDS